MNIVEVFRKYNDGLIILVSGLSGSGKKKLASSIAKWFGLELINIDKFCKDAGPSVELSNGITVTDWDSIDTYNWDEINKVVTASNGCVVCGAYFTTDVITFKPHYHLHVKIAKKKLIEVREAYLKDKPNCQQILANINAIVNQFTYPHYIEYMEKSKIDKYLNANELSQDEIFDSAFGFMIAMIQKFTQENEENINKKVYGISGTKLKLDNGNENSDNGIYLGTTAYVNNMDDYMWPFK